MSFYYVATPYTKYSGGLNDAFNLACIQTALLIEQGIHAFSPIAHGHALKRYTSLANDNHDFWLSLDLSFMKAAQGLIVVKAKGWDESFGVAEEIRIFTDMGKPIFYMEPGLIPEGLHGNQDRDTTRGIHPSGGSRGTSQGAPSRARKGKAPKG